MDTKMAIFSSNKLSGSPVDGTVSLTSNQTSSSMEVDEHSNPKRSANGEEVHAIAVEETRDVYEASNNPLPIAPTRVTANCPGVPESDVAPELLLLESRSAAPNAQVPFMEERFCEPIWQRPYYDQAHFPMSGPPYYGGNTSQMECQGGGMWQREEAPQPMHVYNESESQYLRQGMHPQTIPWQPSSILSYPGVPVSPWQRPVCYGDMHPPPLMPQFMHPFQVPRLPYQGGPYMPYPGNGSPRHMPPAMRMTQYRTPPPTGRRMSTPRPKRNPNSTPITTVFDGRKITLNYNWPTPGSQEPRKYNTRKRKLEQEELRRKSLKATAQLKESEECTATPSSVYDSCGQTAEVTSSEDVITGTFGDPAPADCSNPVQQNQPTQQESDFGSNRKQRMYTYKTRSSKITRQAAKSSSNKLQNAATEKSSQTISTAKTLFTKRMLTLYGWLYPESTKKDVKISIDGLWDKLPAEEKDFYLSQAEGRFGSRSTGVMINPQLAVLPGLPEDLVRQVMAAPKSVITFPDDNVETDTAVESLLALDSQDTWTATEDTPPDDTPTDEYCFPSVVDPMQLEGEFDQASQYQSDQLFYMEDIGEVESHPSVTLDATPEVDAAPFHDTFGLCMLADMASQRCYMATEEVIDGGDLEIGCEVVVDGGGVMSTMDALGLVADAELAVITERLKKRGMADDYATEWGFVMSPNELLHD